MNKRCSKLNKPHIILIMLLCMMITVSACSSPFSSPVSIDSGNADSCDNDSAKTKTIICAGFAEYDWTRNILGSNPADINLILLNDSGLDMHSYQPSVADMVALSKADLIIFTGGESEKWIKEALISGGKTESCLYQTSETFAHTPELISRYSLECAKEHHSHDNDSRGGHHHEHKFDEHLWLSLKLAPVFIDEISKKIIALDPLNTDTYKANSISYIDKIKKLDKSFDETLSSASSSQKNLLLFADRFPFKYMLEDYKLEHCAAFPGCSAETEASFATIVSLSETMRSKNLSSVIILKKSKTDLAETIIATSKQRRSKILVLDSMQSVTASDVENGLTYISAMQGNLNAVCKALDLKSNSEKG